MSAPVRFVELTRDDLGARAAGAVLVLPVGSTEQHGPHLTTGTDALLCETVALRAAEAAAADAIVAPVLPLGASAHHLPFGGTLSLSEDTLARVLGDAVESAVVSGFRRVLILNGHGGNTATCRAVAPAAAERTGTLVEAACYWDGAEIEGPEAVPGHAGLFETSLVLALHPARVRWALVRPSPGRPPWGRGPATPERWREIDGFSDVPQLAAARPGAVWLAACVAAVAATIERMGGSDVRT